MICARRPKNSHSTYTSFGNEICGLVWSGGSPFRGGSSFYRVTYIGEGADSGIDTSRKPKYAAEGYNGAKLRHRDLGTLGVPIKLI